MNMIRNRTFFTTIAVLTLAFTACKEEDGSTPPNPKDSISINPPSLPKFKAEGGTMTVTVDANNEWSMSHKDNSSSSWLRMSPYYEKYGAGTKTIELKALENTSKVTRTDTIIFTCGTAVPIKLEVTQNGISYLDVSPEELPSFKADGTCKGNDTFTIDSNIDWTITCPSDWCHVSPKNGSENKEIKVTADSYDGTTQRKATFTIAPNEDSLKEKLVRTVTVTQDGVTLYTRVISPVELDFGIDTDTKYIEIESNEEWGFNISGDLSCISAVTPETNKIAVTTNDNKTDKQHVATVTVYGKSSKDATIVTIRQECIKLSIMPESKSFGKEAADDIFTVSCNTTWSATSSDESWCTIRSLDNKTLIISVTENKSFTKRDAKVTIKAGEVERYIIVTQSPTLPTPFYIYIDGDKNPTIASTGGKLPVKIITNDGPFKVSGYTEWYEIKDKTDNSFVIDVKKNGSLSKRTATITVTSNSGKTDTLTVTQKAGNIGIEEYD